MIETIIERVRKSFRFEVEHKGNVRGSIRIEIKHNDSGRDCIDNQSCLKNCYPL